MFDAQGLDTPTPGVLPLAFGTESSMEKWLVAQLAARLVEKEYLCLCLLTALAILSRCLLALRTLR